MSEGERLAGGEEMEEEVRDLGWGVVVHRGVVDLRKVSGRCQEGVRLSVSSSGGGVQ